ncbi:ectoine hydroxylase [Bacterioplanes sanyensis]|uniref:ectoine hydroxylase n=1 Tax=Bacterioplanes sanyensis TaxID=1249553 RepID=UPI00167A797F|nr:ectoine hydroxylase [Bacterioplanes sanyensis]GGY42581.1 ectoine hydroxylase [Bacterioplanes sanyensis]
MQDFYPTRTSSPQPMIKRREPIIHGGAGFLSQQQLQRYERDGFLVIEDFLPPSETQQFLRDLDAYQQDSTFIQRPEVIAEPNEQSIRSIFAIHTLSERFKTLVRDQRLLSLARQITGDDVYVHQSRLNDKPAFVGKGFNWHSDFETWHAEDGMPAMRAFSVSIMLTDNQPHNGPLMLIPGSHRWFVPTMGKTPANNWQTSLKNQQIGVPDAESLRELTAGVDSEQAVPGVHVPSSKAGSLLIFDCNVLHASSDNLSPWPRRNLFFVYNSIHNRLQAPFAADRPRPEYLATREPVALRAADARSVTKA